AAEFLFTVLPPPGGIPAYAVGAGPGGGPDIEVYGADGSHLYGFFAYDPGFRGGVRVALADVSGDGVPDIITAPGPGGGPNLRAFDGQTGAMSRNFFAFDPGFTGGLFVAAGDLNSDGQADIVVGADAGGGPRVTVFSGKDGAVLDDFFAYDSGFR